MRHPEVWRSALVALNHRLITSDWKKWMTASVSNCEIILKLLLTEQFLLFLTHSISCWSLDLCRCALDRIWCNCCAKCRRQEQSMLLFYVGYIKSIRTSHCGSKSESHMSVFAKIVTWVFKDVYNCTHLC